MNAGSGNFQSAYGSGYINNLVFATNGTVYVSDPFGTVSTAGNQSTKFFSPTNPISMCFLNLGVYMTDGSTLAYLNTSTGNMVAYSTTFNNYSTSTDPAPTFCAQDVTWRGRLILYQDQNNPQNIYAARTGNPYDFNYAATDPASAWSANFSESGQIGQPVTAFIPFNDDLAIVSCIDQMWLIEGDPSDGGTFVLMSEHMGMLGPQAWCTAPNHDLYFVGTSGMYMLRPFWAQYMPPQLLTGQNYDQFFTQLDRNQMNVALVYDEVHKYIHIYVTPYSTYLGGISGTHLIFDTRNNGLWPVQYASTAGPSCATSFVPGSLGNKQILALGGLNGNVYQINDSATDDVGTAIQSNITFAPINPLPDRAAIMQKIEVDMGELPSTYSTFNSKLSVLAGPTAADVDVDGYGWPSQSTNLPGFTKTFTMDRRQAIIQQRLGGGWFSITLGNSTDQATWSFERAVLNFTPSGVNRQQR
jgi:hypothetical protein